MSDAVIYTTPMVNKDYKGKRIDKFLSDCFPDVSRSQVQRLIALGNVTCGSGFCVLSEVEEETDDQRKKTAP